MDATHAWSIAGNFITLMVMIDVGRTPDAT